MRKYFIACILLLLLAGNSTVQAQQILSVKEQSRVIDEILGERINILLPQLMKREGIDMWVIISREYNEDPIIKTFLPAIWLAARRRTILVFYHNPTTNTYEKFAVARYNVGEHIKAAWEPEKQPDQWQALIDIIQQRNPQKIALNYSASFGHADGIDLTDYKEFTERLPANLKSRVTSAEKLGVAWLETRTEREMQIYPQLVSITHQIIEEGFSERVITPGITTTDDVVWWFRQKISDLGLSTWFHPSVAVQRNDPESFEHLRAFSNRPKEDLIRPGDLLHVDIGITYLRLNTDIQQHAYVLSPTETDAPANLHKAFAQSNRVQDILTSQFKLGKSGNQILKDALDQCKKEGIKATIYTHPLGFHGHAAGPTIGMWDNQNGIPGSGDYPMYNHTAYSIELNSEYEIPEWKKKIRMMLEEDGYYDAKGFRYINGRQRQLLLIPRQKSQIGK